MQVIVKYPRMFGDKETKEVSFEFTSDATSENTLETIFHGFNHGSGREFPVFLNSNIRSLSVGDFVCMEGCWFQCAPVGWVAMKEENVNEIMAMPEYSSAKDKILWEGR